jgi:hypothetical protein
LDRRLQPPILVGGASYVEIRALSFCAALWRAYVDVPSWEKAVKTKHYAKII